MIPSLFLSHGSPMLALEDTPTTRFLRGLGSLFPRPKAIIVASAHWETPMPMVTGAVAPETIHDFHGFPPELYRLQYPAKGDPVLAGRVQALLAEAGFAAGIDPKRGFDHGVWNPLMVAYPQADIPVIAVSLQSGKDAAWHYRLGQTLAPLRAEDILIIGSGNATHNLREAFRPHAVTPPWVTAFADGLAERLAQGDVEGLLQWQSFMPHAAANHPTPEHFLPLFVAMGAGGAPLQAKRLHQEVALGVLAMDAYAFGVL